MTTIAIIGAGMAGLAAAERLRAHGVRSVLFDKSRGFGGRMATRRSGDFQWDHGAQYFTARGPEFFAAVAQWRDDGHAAEWAPGSFVGAPGMTAPARAMAANHECITEATVTRLTRDAGGWSVFDEKGVIAAPGNGAYAAALLALPAPQAIPLAASAGVNMPKLTLATYAPCIALMLAYPPETRAPAEAWIRPDDSAVAWIARNSSKPGRQGGAQTWVVHARPDWSRAHLEEQAEFWREALLERFRAITGVLAEPLHVSAHRWRYALVEQEVGLPCLFDAEQRFGACGDWCLGPRVEAAFDSGCAMADTVLKALR